MTKALTVPDEKFEALREEIKASFTEHVFAAREEVILAHHEAGKLITEYAKESGTKITLLVEQLSKGGAAKQSTLWLSCQFYRKYTNFNDIEKLGHGKNISWNKIRKAIAPEVTEEAIVETKVPKGYTLVGKIFGLRLLVETTDEDVLEHVFEAFRDLTKSNMSVDLRLLPNVK